MSIEAMKQASALICSARLCEVNSMSSRQEMLRLMIEATDILRAAIEQVQEPVAWVCYGSASDEKHTIDYWQEDIDAIPVGTMLYAAPPPRQWQGLTDQEIWSDGSTMDLSEDGIRNFARAIEAKLREKNT